MVNVNTLKLAARRLIALTGLTLAASIVVLIGDLHDLRLMVAVGVGMAGREVATKLVDRIKFLRDDEDVDLMR